MMEIAFDSKKLELLGIEGDRLPFIWEGKPYYGIERFDCHVVDLNVTKFGGGYCTTIPISSLEYRIKHGTKCKVKINHSCRYVHFTCTDDLGHSHLMSIPKYELELIEIAKQAAIDQQLIEDVIQ